MREQLGADVTNPAFDLQIRDKPFFEALAEVARQAEVAMEFSSGDGSIGIKPAMTAATDDKPAAARPVQRPVPHPAQADRR